MEAILLSALKKSDVSSSNLTFNCSRLTLAWLAPCWPCILSNPHLSSLEHSFEHQDMGLCFGSPWCSMSELNGLFPIGISNIEVLRFRRLSLHFMCRDFFFLRSFLLVLKNKTNGTTVELTHIKIEQQ